MTVVYVVSEWVSLIGLTASAMFVAWFVVNLLKSITGYFRQKTIESEIIVKAQIAPKKDPKHPGPYLEFNPAIQALKNHVKITFQRVYTGDVLPSIMNSENRVVFAAPNDKKYSEILNSIIFQTFVLMPDYLKKSLFFYFGVADPNKPEEDQGFKTLSRYILSQVKGLLDSQLVTLAERMEKSGASSQPFIDAVKSYGSVLRDIDDLIGLDGRKELKVASPDGTPATTY